MYSSGASFKSWLGHKLFPLRFFHGFPQSFQANAEMENKSNYAITTSFSTFQFIFTSDPRVQGHVASDTDSTIYIKWLGMCTLLTSCSGNDGGVPT